MSSKNPCFPKDLLFQAALRACRAHPRDGRAAHHAFLVALSDLGVRTQRLPDLVMDSVRGAVDRSLGNPRVAAGHILNDLAPMMAWLRLMPMRTAAWPCAEAA
jgi:hypothetical protein